MSNDTAKKMYTKCAKCGYVYPHKWEQDHCNSERACNSRKEINAAQRKLKLPVTKWDMHGHDLARAARKARVAIKAELAKRAAARSTPAQPAQRTPAQPAQPAQVEQPAA